MRNNTKVAKQVQELFNITEPYFVSSYFTFCSNKQAIASRQKEKRILGFPARIKNEG